MKILKELVFSRVMVYNILQMFSFVTELLQIYHQNKLMSIANNRKKTYIAPEFQGIKADKVAKDGHHWEWVVQTQTNKEQDY